MSLFELARRLLGNKTVVAAIALGCSLSSFAEVRTPYTEADLRDAVPMGVPGVRAWADAPLSVLQEQVTALPTFEGSGVFSILVLSDGGEHGAFGAGLLTGWSESGQRPIFNIVHRGRR